MTLDRMKTTALTATRDALTEEEAENEPEEFRTIVGESSGTRSLYTLKYEKQREESSPHEENDYSQKAALLKPVQVPVS